MRVFSILTTPAFTAREYKQHNPDALSGKQAAVDFLIKLWGTPGIGFSNISAWAGEGFGMMHYRYGSSSQSSRERVLTLLRIRMKAPEFDYAVMDRLKFKGTCFDEHWDVLQRIWGNETNPIAFF